MYAQFGYVGRDWSCTQRLVIYAQIGHVHKLVMYTQAGHVHINWLCSIRLVRYTQAGHVHTGWSCTHRLVMFTQAGYVRGMNEGIKGDEPVLPVVKKVGEI